MSESVEWVFIACDMASKACLDKGSDWTTVGVAIITALAGLGGAWLTFAWHAGLERKSTRSAILAEIEGLVEMVRHRNYQEGLRTRIAVIAAVPKSQLEDECFSFSVKISENYNTIYRQNASKIGLLSEKDAVEIVRFYQIVDGLRTDVTEGGVLDLGKGDLEAFLEAQKLLTLALEIAAGLLSRNR